MLITSSAVHEIDIVRWLLGEEIVGATVRAARSTSQAANGLRDPQLVLLETAGGETGTTVLEEQVEPDFRARFATAYRRELEAWVGAVTDGPGPGPSAWDGYVANAVADACIESLGSGARVSVRLEERPPLYA